MKRHLLVVILIAPMLLTALVHRVNHIDSYGFTSIQSAVNYASSNDTILIYPGTYIENVIINSKSLTLASLELTTGDSTYIAQTIINGNQTGSCVRIVNSEDVLIRGLYLTNGIGSNDYSGNPDNGGGIYAYSSNIKVSNCRIMHNRNVYSGGGIYISLSNVFFSGSIIAYNHSNKGGGVNIFGDASMTFDNINRCSVFLNNAVWGSDFSIGVINHPQINLDKFSVPVSHCDISEYIYTGEDMPYTLVFNTSVIIPQYADFYVSTEGSDNNSGLAPGQPLKTIAMALHKIRADSLHQHKIYLANGVYSNSNNGQYLPINLKSYVSFVGESESSTIIDGDNRFSAFGGYNSEQAAVIKNMTIQNCKIRGVLTRAIVECISRLRDEQGETIFLSLVMENITIKNCHPIDYMDVGTIVNISSTNSLILRNLTIDDCTGQWGLILGGSNILGENIRIRNFRYAYISENCGNAMNVHSNYLFNGRPNVFTNLEITNCESNQQDWALSTALGIFGQHNTVNPTENYFINATIADYVCRPSHGSAVSICDGGKATFVNSVISNNFPHSVKLFNDWGYNRVRFMNTLIGQCPTGEAPVVDSNPNRNIIEWYGVNLSRFPNFDTENTEFPYSLSIDSPCIDAGVTEMEDFDLPDSFQFPLQDLAGNSRVNGSNVDIGAYEWTATANPEEDIPLADVSTMSIYPNPFKQTATISFQHMSKSMLEIDVFNVKGQLVKTLLSEHKNSGSNQITWDGRDHNGKMCSSGIYYCRVISNDKIYTRKLMLVK